MGVKLTPKLGGLKVEQVAGAALQRPKEHFCDEVWQGDCLDLLGLLPNNSIDTTITSPPYNKGEQGAVLIKAVKYDNYSDKVPEKDYQAKQIAILNELYRKTKKGGSCFYNHRPRWDRGNPIYPYDWLRKTKWQKRQLIIWHRKICGNIRGWRFYQTYEEIWWLWKPNGKSGVDNELDTRSASLSSVWYLRPNVNGENKHPCVFPIEIPARAILATTKPGDLIFDPFAGTGTTLVAANQLDRKYLGMDISPEYVGISQGRLSTPFASDIERVAAEAELHLRDNDNPYRLKRQEKLVNSV